ncbi:MAG TPA: hypothetical protein IAB35_06170 [Candidatus Faecimonas gallistercoris]|nr:hypothetical protein [Candidatus Faecimonas gallistercoris]
MFFVCMLLPASFSILISEKLKKEKKSLRDLILSYFSYTFFITMIMNTLIYFISSEKSFWYRTETFTYDFCLKYMWLSFVIAIVLPYLLHIVQKAVKINIEVKERSRDDKKNIKKKH